MSKKKKKRKRGKKRATKKWSPPPVRDIINYILDKYPGPSTAKPAGVYRYTERGMGTTGQRSERHA